MLIESIAATAALAQPDAAPAAVRPPAGDFGQWFAHELKSVNTSLSVADTDVKKLAAGEAQSLHEVMIHLEEAKLSFQLLAQVRNRLLDAYQEVMRMQV